MTMCLCRGRVSMCLAHHHFRCSVADIVLSSPLDLGPPISPTVPCHWPRNSSATATGLTLQRLTRDFVSQY
ncbi:hypothetical protein J6590_000337 [Homalodisca vitripennis]|nr:hypothetical protein J6590_000337 [Homalodisca vitripennis]